jgi:hypothetical protein
MIRDALRLMAECTLEEGDKLPRPNPRARDKKAVFREILPLQIKARIGAVA